MGHPFLIQNILGHSHLYFITTDLTKITALMIWGDSIFIKLCFSKTFKPLVFSGIRHKLKGHIYICTLLRSSLIRSTVGASTKDALLCSSLVYYALGAHVYACVHLLHRKNPYSHLDLLPANGGNKFTCD